MSDAPRDLFQPQAGLHWEFGGFAAVNERLETLDEVKRHRQLRMAELGLALPCPAVCNGWIAIDDAGEVLDCRSLDEAFVRTMLAPYIAKVARHTKDEDTVRSALERIGEAFAGDVEARSLIARVVPRCAGLPLAGDGKLAPEGWRRLPDGRVLKQNATATGMRPQLGGAAIDPVGRRGCYRGMADERRSTWHSSGVP